MLSLDIADDELVARCVFSPRNINPKTGNLRNNFMFLREGEQDISFVRYSKLGHEETVRYGNSIMRNQLLYALAKGLAGELRSISDMIHITADNPSNPYHASLRILKDGKCIQGIVTDALVLDLFDKILEHLELKIL